MYKIEIFAPESALYDIRNVLLEKDAGHIGNYRGCLSYYPVTGIWFSENGAHPSVGHAGEWSKETEIKIEVNVEDSIVRDVVASIKAVHPYEEPVINIIPLSEL